MSTRRPTAALAALALAGALASAAPPARAQAPAADAGATPAAPAVDDVETHLRRGVELREQGRDEDALREFQRAYELDRGPRTLAQVALAEQALGRWVEADAHLREALSNAAHPWVAQNRAALESSLATIAEHVGRVEVRGNVAGAQVLVNGAAVGTLPLREPVRVVTGSVAILVQAPDYLPSVRTVVVTPNSLARETFNLVPIPGSGASGGVDPAGGATVTPRARGAGRAREVSPSPLIWVGAGAVVVAAGTAIALSLAGNGVQQGYLDRCVEGPARPDECRTDFDRSQGQLNGIAASVNVLWGVAAVGAITLGAGLLLTDWRPRAEAPRARARASAGVAPLFGLGYAGARVTW